MKKEDALTIEYVNSNDIVNDACNIIDTAQKVAYSTVNITLVQRNWLLGKRIAEEELKNELRAEYGAEVIKSLSKGLTERYGKGYTKSNIYNFYNFYKLYPNIFQTLSGKFSAKLSWSHYLVLMQVNDKDARDWYEKEAINETWSVRTLQRNVSSQYYYRLLKSQIKEPVVEEMKEKTKLYQEEKLEFIKNPMIVEFLGLSTDPTYSETQMEGAIISNLQNFLVEMGKGYAFVARQQHIHTEKEDYYIDLVFYNYILKCFVLVDLKTSKITHQDVGQMDMYIRMYDELKRGDGDNPTLGIVLCTETDEDIAKYSILKGNEQLFASKYKLYLPSEEELRAEIESQKTIFEIQKCREKEEFDYMIKQGLDQAKRGQGMKLEDAFDKIRKDVENEINVLTLDSITSLLLPIAKKYEIKTLSVFGSYARNEATPTSDVDILIDGGNYHGLIEYMAMINEMKAALGREVDVITQNALNEGKTRADKMFKDHVEKEKRVLIQLV